MLFSHVPVSPYAEKVFPATAILQRMSENCKPVSSYIQVTLPVAMLGVVLSLQTI